MKLLGMSNLFFTYIPVPEAEVKYFLLGHELFTDKLRVVTFSYESALMNISALRGVIAHEIAHVYNEHLPDRNEAEAEDEANDLAKAWGFEKEIKALREHSERYSERMESVKDMERRWR